MPDENLYLSRSFQPPDETIFSSGASGVTVADELIEMVQYMATMPQHRLRSDSYVLVLCT